MLSRVIGSFQRLAGASLRSARSIFIYHYRHVLGRFPVGRMCSATSRIDFRSAECVLPRSGSFSVGRVCSVNSRSAGCVPPCPEMISVRQSVFCRVPG